MEDNRKYTAFSHIKGDLGQKIVEQKCFSKLSKGVKIIDGHNEFSSINLKPLIFEDKEILPQHLDIVGINSKTEVKFICEVKTTITKNMEFQANGYCMAFMMEAQILKIPISLAIVRLDREMNQNIVKSFDPKTRKAKVDRNLIESEFAYALNHAKIEFYKETDFKIAENRFIINILP